MGMTSDDWGESGDPLFGLAFLAGVAFLIFYLIGDCIFG